MIAMVALISKPRPLSRSIQVVGETCCIWWSLIGLATRLLIRWTMLYGHRLYDICMLSCVVHTWIETRRKFPRLFKANNECRYVVFRTGRNLKTFLQALYQGAGIDSVYIFSPFLYPHSPFLFNPVSTKQLYPLTPTRPPLCCTFGFCRCMWQRRNWWLRNGYTHMCTELQCE